MDFTSWWEEWQTYHKRIQRGIKHCSPFCSILQRGDEDMKTDSYCLFLSIKWWWENSAEPKWERRHGVELLFHKQENKVFKLKPFWFRHLQPLSVPVLIIRLRLAFSHESRQTSSPLKFENAWTWILSWHKSEWGILSDLVGLTCVTCHFPVLHWGNLAELSFRRCWFRSLEKQIPKQNLSVNY